MTGIGDVDWLDVWRSTCADVERASHGAAPPGDRWRERAARFDRMGRERPPDGVVGALGALLRPGDVVLDIGAGTGRHTVPLAGACSRVVAIEPSDAMRQHLTARVAEEGLANVEIVADEWPRAASACRGDVAFSSHVLYGVHDLAAFVEAMTRSARRLSVLVLGLRAPADALAELWRALHGAPRPSRPAALEAFAALHQLGLQASLVLLEGTERPVTFGTSDEDVREACLRVGVAADPGGAGAVRQALRRFPQDEHGRHVVGVAGPTALIRWEGAAHFESARASSA